MEKCNIIQSVIIGAGGGITVGLFFLTVTWIKNKRKTNKIHSWMKSNINKDNQWRTTHAIASYIDLTEDDVRRLCSTSKQICRNSKEKESWGIKNFSREKKNVW